MGQIESRPKQHAGTLEGWGYQPNHLYTEKLSAVTYLYEIGSYDFLADAIDGGGDLPTHAGLVEGSVAYRD